MGTIRFSQPSKIETLDDPVTHVKMRGSDAGIAQLVEHDLAKVGVASSSLVSRSSFQIRPQVNARGLVV